jgi:DNA-binding MarR family transcriptional regulator
MDELDAFIAALRELFFTLRRTTEQLQSGLDCTAAERGILMELEQRGPLTVPAMAEGRGVSRQAMQKSVDALLGRRLVALAENPRHRRSSLVEITPAGRRLFVELRAREEKALAAVELPLSAAELRRVTTSLETLARFFAGRDWSKGARR